MIRQPNRDHEPDKVDALREGSKLFHDAFKHVTTLSTGSIVFIATFLDKFKASVHTELAAYALYGFVLSVITSVLWMLFLAKDVSTKGRYHWYDVFFHVGSWLSVLSFIVSVLLLVVFARVNMPMRFRRGSGGQSLGRTSLT